MSKYMDIHRRSIENPSEFWAEAAEDIDWESRWDKVLDDSNAPIYRWFSGGRLNTCYNALDRHVENGRGEQAAIIYDSPVTGSQRTISFSELLDDVALFAGALVKNGVKQGDRVIIYMPMIPEAVVAVQVAGPLGVEENGILQPCAGHARVVEADEEDVTPARISARGER